jgi:hypothetical protein
VSQHEFVTILTAIHDCGAAAPFLFAFAAGIGDGWLQAPIFRGSEPERATVKRPIQSNRTIAVIRTSQQ